MIPVYSFTRVLFTNAQRTRGRGCNGHPAFPTPSEGREIHAQLGRIRPRGCKAVSENSDAVFEIRIRGDALRFVSV